MSLVVFFSCWKWLAQFYFFKKYPNKAYMLYRPCWVANLSRRGEFHSVCPEMGCAFLKHIKPGISFNFFHYRILNSIDFYAWTIICILYLYKLFFQNSLNVTRYFRIKNSWPHRNMQNFVYFLTVATIWGVMLTKRRWAPKKFWRISKWVVHY